MWKVIHLNKKDKTCLIRKEHGRSYPCRLAPGIVEGIQLLDYVTVKFNPVSREWTVVDYQINFPVAASIHNSYQEGLPEDEQDYIYDEKGELYE